MPRTKVFTRKSCMLMYIEQMIVRLLSIIIKKTSRQICSQPEEAKTISVVVVATIQYFNLCICILGYTQQ